MIFLKNVQTNRIGFGKYSIHFKCLTTKKKKMKKIKKCRLILKKCLRLALKISQLLHLLKYKILLCKCLWENSTET